MATFPQVTLDGYWIDLGSILLRWSSSAGASAYRIYQNGVSQSQTVAQQSATVTGLSLDTPYTFNVVAVDGSGNDSSRISNPVYFEHGSNEIGNYFSNPGVSNFNGN